MQISYIVFFEIDLCLQEIGIHQCVRGVYETMKKNAQLEPDGAKRQLPPRSWASYCFVYMAYDFQPTIILLPIPSLLFNYHL